MESQARTIGRLAALGLGLAFVALIACTLWATARIQRAADHASAAVSLSDLYATVIHDLTVEQALARRHQSDLNYSGWNRQLQASIATHATLMTISGAPE